MSTVFMNFESFCKPRAPHLGIGSLANNRAGRASALNRMQSALIQGSTFHLTLIDTANRSIGAMDYPLAESCNVKGLSMQQSEAAARVDRAYAAYPSTSGNYGINARDLVRRANI